jgi:hypothetical protein
MADTTKRITPAPLPISSRLKTVCVVLMFLGVATFAVMLMKDRDRAWHDYLVAYFYFFTIALGGLFFTSVQHLTKAGWSVNVRRFCESFTAFLPVAAVGAIGLVVGGSHLYEWMDKTKVAADELLQHKSGYLNPTFWVIRMVLFFTLWLIFSKKLVGFSVAQDKTGDDNLTHKTVGWSIAFLLSFALSYSLFGVDLIMSLQPHWYSTIFGVYLFAGLFQSTIAMMILLIQYCMKKGLLIGYVNENHMHDLGKFMFAFTVFWAYIAYSQYMLIWYANLPEETAFYIPRVTGSWTIVSACLLLFKFVVPFLALLSRRAKRDPNMLKAVAILILIMQYVDLHWLIFPNLNAQEVLLGIPEVLIWGGFAGAFLFVVTRFLSQHPIVPLKDPRIQESLHHHVVY